MIGATSAERFVFRSTCALVSYQVRIGATKACRAHGLMRVDHDTVLGSLLHHIKIVLVHGL